MVYLNRIYTKTGDEGETSLGNGDRVPKTHQRIIAYGSVDELNSAIGCALAAGPDQELTNLLMQVQNDLFDVGADLCIPESNQPLPYTPLRVTEAQVLQLEQWIDRANERLEPLTSFILPGGTPVASQLHLARTICRRSEIEVLRLKLAEQVNPQVLIYLNRLSDLLFVLARDANGHGKQDVLWIPGAKRNSAPTELK